MRGKRMSTNRGAAESFRRWRNWPEGLDALLRDQAVWAQRAAAVARWLREALPEVPLAACRFTVAGQEFLAVDPEDRARHATLSSQLTALAPLSGEVNSLTLPEGPLVWATAISGPGAAWGHLVLAEPPGATAEVQAGAQLALRLTAAHLACRLSLEAQAAELADLVTIAEATGTLTHDLSNHLNSIMLQAAVLEMQAPNLAKEAAVLRAEGKKGAACLQPLQQFRQQRRGPGVKADLHAILAHYRALHPQRLLRDEQTTTPAWIAVDARTLERTLLVLLRLLQGERPEPAPVRVQVTMTKDTITLLAECTVPPPAKGGNLADELVRTDSMLLPLERLALRSLLRSSRGTLKPHPETPAKSVLIQWPRQNEG